MPPTASSEGNTTHDQREEDPITIKELQAISHRRLPKNVYEYYECGADDQITLQRNNKDFDRLYICPRVLRDVSRVSTSTKLWGHEFSIPIGIAPSAMHKLASPEGENAVARAAVKMGINMTLSSQSTTPLETVISARQRHRQDSVAPFWFQIYLTADLQNSIPLIERAEAAGYEALVLTVDTAVLGNRLNERKVPLVLPSHLKLANIEAGHSSGPRKPTVNRLLMDSRTAAEADKIIQSEGASMHSSSLTWESTLRFLRQTTSMRVILKGIMTPEDALLAVRYGADAIIVSNHGGRQLDSVPSTIEVLPSIVEAVEKKIPVIFDGGIRRGSDVFKALALGADLVCVGRPALWGLAYKDQEGVETMINILERELSRTMALAGVTKVAEINRSLLGVSRTLFGVARL